MVFLFLEILALIIFIASLFVIMWCKRCKEELVNNSYQTLQEVDAWLGTYLDYVETSIQYSVRECDNK